MPQSELHPKNDEEPNARQTNAIDTHIGNRLRLSRLMLGMSQEKLGERVGLTFQQIQKYEKGVNRISASRLYELASILGVSLHYFFEGLADDTQARQANGTEELASIMGLIQTPQGVALNKAFLRITDARVRHSFVALLAAVADGEDGRGEG